MNNLRDDLKKMTTKEKEEKLKELQEILFSEYGKEKSHSMGSNAPKSGPHSTWILRRCIAMVKTSLHMEGYHYYHRG